MALKIVATVNAGPAVARAKATMTEREVRLMDDTLSAAQLQQRIYYALTANWKQITGERNGGVGTTIGTRREDKYSKNELVSVSIGWEFNPQEPEETAPAINGSAMTAQIEAICEQVYNAREWVTQKKPRMVTCAHCDETINTAKHAYALLEVEAMGGDDDERPVTLHLHEACISRFADRLHGSVFNPLAKE